MVARESLATARTARAAIYTRTDVAMDTLISARIDTARPAAVAEGALDRALAWFARVESACSRFDPESEVVRLASRPRVAVRVSPILLECVAFAIELARLTNGRFDPTIGARQQRRGLNTNYIAGRSTVEPALLAAETGSFRDVAIDRAAGTITLARPLLLDLGAVAKGFAIDLAARELAGFERYAVEAGGDLFAGGREGAAPWRIGIRSPREGAGFLATVAVMNASVCTSGGYERRRDAAGEHHILDPFTGRSPRSLLSATVLAPSAIVADALATAAFVLGPVAGTAFLVDQGAGGLLALGDGSMAMTPGFEAYLS